MRVPDISNPQTPQKWVRYLCGRAGVPWVAVQNASYHLQHPVWDAEQYLIEQIQEDADDACTDTV